MPDESVFQDGIIGRASDLVPEAEPEELGFSQDDLKYKGFPRREVSKPLHPKHDLKRGFYVVSARENCYGYVPWPGSQIVWPWEAGWEQDLKREIITERPKPEGKKK